MADEAILEAARAIRPYLEALGADAIDGRLAGLIVARDEVGIVGLMGEREATLEWFSAHLGRGAPSDVEMESVRYAGLPGHGEPPPAAHRYVCAEGDYVWWRRGAEPLRHCPTHPQLALRQEDA
jgi:hypothetical protein